MGDDDRVGLLLPERDDDDGSSVRPFGLGSVLIWARSETRPIVVVAPEDRASNLARQAEAFEQVSVWTIAGTTISEATSQELPSIPELPPAVRDRAAMFESVGALALDDFGRLIAEVEGLEIARATGEDGTIEIGVGTADRELHGYVHGQRDPLESLHSAAEMVRSVRRQGAAGHPLNRRARQRWLRAHAFDNPDSVGVGQLEMLPPLGQRELQLGPEPAAALDPDANALYVFSAGIDPEAVPAATDYRRRHRPDRTVIVTSHLDSFGATEQIAENAGIDTMAITAPY